MPVTAQLVGQYFSSGFPVKKMGTYPTTKESVWLLSQGFAENPNNGVYGPEGHTGHDYLCSEGTEIFATFDGEIVFAGASYCGDWIRIVSNPFMVGEKECVLMACYGHVSRIDVSVGQRIIKGQLIGLTGNTGYPRCSTGAHLHYELVLGVKDESMERQKLENLYNLYGEKGYYLNSFSAWAWFNRHFLVSGDSCYRVDEHARGAIDPLPIYEKPNLVRIRRGGAMVLYRDGLRDAPGVGAAYAKENEGKNVKGDGPEIYHIQGGKKRQYPDEATMWAHGFATTQFVRISEELLRSVPAGEAMDYYEGTSSDVLRQVFFEVGAGNAQKFFEKYHSV